MDSAACRARGVKAFTADTHSTFADVAPPLRVAAHEAVHQLQHDGRTRDAFLGAERHAEAVADRLTHGRRARDLIGVGGDRVTARSHDYVQIARPEEAGAPTGAALAGMYPLKVADTGKAVTSIVPEKKKTLFAAKELIEQANRVLGGQDAGVRLKSGARKITTRLGPAAGAALHSVEPVFRMNKNPRDKRMYVDCGESSREIAGPSGRDQPMVGVFGSGEECITSAPERDSWLIQDEFMIKSGLGKDATEGMKNYRDMSPEEADAFDRRYGINRYASPGIGEAYSKTEEEDGNADWYFHWGTVVVKTGDDAITLESAAPPGQKDLFKKGKKWTFEMYGPASKNDGQTFHETWLNELGPRSGGSMTFRARHEGSEKPTQGVYAVLTKIGGGQFESITAAELSALDDADRAEVVALTRSAIKLHGESPRGRAAAKFLQGIAP